LVPAARTRAFAIGLRVPEQFPTIQAALDAAAPGDVVTVAAGEHAGGAVVRTSLTLQGAGREATIVRGGLRVEGGVALTVEDLALVGAGSGTGVGGAGVELSVRRCAVSGFQWGVAVGEGELLLEASRIWGNVWGVDLEQANGTVVNNELLNNAKAGLVTRWACRTRILHNTVVGNGFQGDADEGAGGLALGAFGREQVSNNLVVGNRFGLSCQSCDARFDHNGVWGNSEDYAGDAAPSGTDLGLDPLFVDPGEQDFGLRADSPCVDAGGDVGVATDAGGAPRPAGAAPDLGAWERPVAAASLVVNEVMANPLSEARGEFVELYNAGDEPVDVAGFVLTDGDAQDRLQGWQGGTTVVPAGAFAVVLDTGFDGDYELPPGAVLLSTGDAQLGNGLAVGDPVGLLLPDGATLLSSYSFPFNPGNGVSAERRAPDAPDKADAWLGCPCAASPGAPNCVFAPPEPQGLRRLLITEVMANPLNEATGEFVELYNAGDLPLQVTDLLLSDGDSDDTILSRQGADAELAPGGWAVVLDRDFAGDYPLPDDALLLTVGDGRLGNGLSTNDPITVHAPSGELLAGFGQPFDPGNGRSAERTSLQDPEGPGEWVAAPCPEAPFASPGGANCAAGDGPDPDGEPVDPGSLTLVINEVMANPLDEDRGEFVELFNYGTKPVAAAGLVLDDGDAQDVLVDPQGGEGTIPAGAYALILDPEHDGSYSLPADAVVLLPDDTTLGSGLTTNDPLALLTADASVVVSTFSFPFNPGNGRSAERVDDRGDVASNWVASPCPAGSSPARVNCAAAGEGPPVEPEEVPQVVINEVMANPTDERTAEFVELLNLGPEPVDLTGYVLSDGDAIDTLEGFDGGPAVLEAGGFGVVLDRDYVGGYDLGPDATLLVTDDRSIGSGLANSDPITLLLPDAATVVSTYGHPFNAGDGRSVERVDPAAPDDPESWVAATCEGPPPVATPGAPNCAAAHEPPEPEGRLVDVNVAAAAELEAIDGIGAATAGSIVAYREAHGAFEQLEQLTALDGVTAARVAGWARLEAGEEAYLGLGPEHLRELVVFGGPAALLDALPDPAEPGEWEGRAVRVERAACLTEGDTGRWRQLSFGAWGDEAVFTPNGAAQIQVYLGAADRDALAVVDALADWDKEDGAPYSAAEVYRWDARLSGAQVIRYGHVFAIEGLLQVYRGRWQIQVRPETDAGMDRLVLYERWLAPELWSELVVVWSYSYAPALVRAQGWSARLPYRLVQSHPCVSHWQQLHGRPPEMMRLRDAGDMGPGAYAEYNQALQTWLQAGAPVP